MGLQADMFMNILFQANISAFDDSDVPPPKANNLE